MNNLIYNIHLFLNSKYKFLTILLIYIILIKLHYINSNEAICMTNDNTNDSNPYNLPYHYNGTHPNSPIYSLSSDNEGTRLAPGSPQFPPYSPAYNPTRLTEHTSPGSIAHIHSQTTATTIESQSSDYVPTPVMFRPFPIIPGLHDTSNSIITNTSSNLPSIPEDWEVPFLDEIEEVKTEGFITPIERPNTSQRASSQSLFRNVLNNIDKN